jgi:hypothetical protein
MNVQEALKWLMDYGGAVIRYRTAMELLESGGGYDMNRLTVELLEDPFVQAWLLSLNPKNVSPRTYHGSFDTCFENATGMLLQLGLRAGMAALDERTRPIRDWFAIMMEAEPSRRDVFAMALFAAFIAYAGYEDNGIIAFLRMRLDTLYSFASLGSYELYDDPDKFKGIPTAFKSKPVIKPELYGGGNYKYPLIYDMYGLAAIVKKGGPLESGKIDTVIRYIMTPEYHQTVADGYGIVVSPSGKYYSMGWDVKLPGFSGFTGEEDQKGPLLLHRLDLMANFPSAVNHEWFTNALCHLERFQTERGTYLFPKQYLREGTGYFVSGIHMSLGENRRAKIALELESTFRMMLIKKRAGML